MLSFVASFLGASLARSNDAASCTAEGDVFIETVTLQFYSCLAGVWVVSAPATDAPKG